ncbi:Aste57867_23733 [Aphanomyces stellatus]|uniref:Aste57867_23733 protein n=1 Tax=Aphanomyces stellatus TaxID=120398 RepID=A0A485LPA0_9STRA|nr:hypothetical protein As57867_023661 [Aphanomyces stellatus]VFU00378.1 Aste57867_23733 [Aphanomyces stellatus]
MATRNRQSSIASIDFKPLRSSFAIMDTLSASPEFKLETPWCDEPHPMTISNWFSIMTMLWIDPLIRRGAQRTLQEEDVWKLCPADTASQLHDRFAVHWETEKKMMQPQFGRALWKTLEAKTLWTTVLYSLYAALTLVQPTVIKWLLQFLSQSNTASVGHASGYDLAALLAVLSIVSVTLIDFGQYLTSNLGVNAKSIVMDTVYLKSLKLSPFAQTTMSSGEIMTLSTVDSERVYQGYLAGPWVVVAPVTLLAIFVLIGIDMGWDVGVVGGVAMAILLYWGFRSAKAVGQARRHVLHVQAQRVKLTNETLQGIRVVKMYAWETFLQDQIAVIRTQELALLRQYQFQRVLNTVMLSIAPVLSLALCLAVYVARGRVLTPEIAFTALAYMNVARLPCSVFSSSIMFASEAWASCARITTFLHVHELDASPQLVQAIKAPSPRIEIAHGHFSWLVDPTLPRPHPTIPATLCNINLTIQPHTLTIVVGAIGSGKSSLISAILGDLHQVGGSRHVKGRMAYVAQEAWIQHASLKQNILFSDALDDARYDSVLSACQLKSDVAILPDGDATEIGERGINLSGGQRARIGLARAMYRAEANIYLLDDPLSALDVHVAGAVFQDCVEGLLKHKTVLLVLNSHYHLLPKADRILVMDSGAIVGDGTYDVIKTTFPHVCLFQDNQDPPPTMPTSTKPRRLTVVKGPKPPLGVGTLVVKEDRSVGAVKRATYMAYFHASGWSGAFVAITIALTFTASQSALSATDWYMGYWSTHPSANHLASIVLYLGLALLSMVLVYGRSVFALFLSIQCSAALHAKLFEKVIHAPVTTFFDVTPVGRVLNRFSNDLDQVDSMLPFLGILFLQFAVQIAAIAVVCAVTSPFILLVYAPIAYLFVVVETYYNTSAAELKRLESISRSPVVNLISETASGLATIRAFGMTTVFATRSRDILDHSQSFFMLYRIASRWMQMRLDWLSSLIIAGVAFIAVASKASIGLTAAGLALTYASQLSASLSRATFKWSMIENIMTSVERLEHYDSLATEGEIEVASITPSADWPAQGNLEFKGYSMRYRDNLDLVLKNVSFSVTGGQKVGICGRTGSGKSSLMAALFRMAEGASGSIEMDGVNIASVALSTLRPRLTIIPQDPVVFSGSLRFNMDPSGLASDDDLWSVLKKVHLTDAVGTDGLEFQVAEKGSNLSVGQRQLLCIARALLRHSRVVVLDEATANIDLESDRLIQQTMKECFKGVTMLVIAHRLDTIIDSDRILVLDRGSVVEYDAPSVLLANDNSAFAQLANQAQLKPASGLNV